MTDVKRSLRQVDGATIATPRSFGRDNGARDAATAMDGDA